MAKTEDETGFLNSGKPRKEPRPMLPWAIAGVVIALIVAALLLSGRHAAPSNPGGAGMAVADPYAASLAITNVKMSEATSLIGAKQIYVDGDITNHGDKTLTGVTVQVAFNDFTNRLAQKDTLPLRLISTHEPNIDVEPVSAAPIAPGQTREFRLIFEHVTDSWNQQYPEIRVIAVETK